MRSHTAHVTRAALVLLLATFGFTGGSLAEDHSCARTCTSMRAVPLSVVVLQPHLNAVTPSPFSPNGDHRDDATVIHFSIPDQETVTYSVITAAAKVVDGPVSLGTLAAGAHVAAWNGQDNAKHRVADGSYTVVLNTSARLGSITARGTSRHAVQVDDTAPSLGAVSGGGATFYPYPDSYLDSWTPTVSVSEAATLSLSLYNSQNLPIQHLTAYHGSAGTYGLTWSGHTSKGTLAPAGTYHGFYRAQDLAGNLHDTATMIVHVSNLRLLNKTATF